MSLPPGFLDELRGRLSLGQVVGRKVMWDNRKSNAGKGDLWAPCPFHQEKTASFHVDDRKGYYYCFGCHAKGDAISFVRETENVGFMEAVEILAREAGVPMPQRDPQAQERSDRRAELANVMDDAVRYYQLQLKTNVASEARGYLERRGISDAVLERWEIGFAPDQRQGVLSHLTGKGYRAEDVIECGLAARPDDGGAPYDRFRGRIIFPIRDVRNRAIALGGRAMDPNARAKYLNSPETILFDKGRSLFNHGPARAASGKGKPLIVAEGYMDVIALVEAGFEASVAPLGTAITESQLQLLWRMHPEPTIALDGDQAGLRAAMRLIDLTLPLLEPGHSLRFALMPDGKDPDDILRDQGSAALSRILEASIPMVDLLWQRETEGKMFDSPERRAGLEKAFRDRLLLIKDPSIRHHYQAALKDRMWQHFRPERRTGWGRGRVQNRPNSPMAETKLSPLASDVAKSDAVREAVIFSVLLVTPEILSEFELVLEAFECTELEHAHIRDAILRNVGAEDVKAAVSKELGPGVLETLFAHSHVRINPAFRKPGDVEMARLCVSEELGKLQAQRGYERELADAMEDLVGVADEGLTWRLSEAAKSLQKAGKGDNEDRAEYERGENGVQLKKEEKEAFDELVRRLNAPKT